MKSLEYTRYVAQGGDWGAPITSAMARQAPAGLLGIHLNLPATIPPEATAALAAGGSAPVSFSEQERATFDAVSTLIKQGNLAYSAMMAARPQMMGYGVTDSPTFLAALMLVHPGFAKWRYGADAQQSPRPSRTTLMPGYFIKIVAGFFSVHTYALCGGIRISGRKFKGTSRTLTQCKGAQYESQQSNNDVCGVGLAVGGCHVGPVSSGR